MLHIYIHCKRTVHQKFKKNLDTEIFEKKNLGLKQ